MRTWIGTIGISFSFAAIIAKLYRVVMIFNNPFRAQKKVGLQI